MLTIWASVKRPYNHALGLGGVTTMKWLLCASVAIALIAAAQARRFLDRFVISADGRLVVAATSTNLYVYRER